VQTAPTLRVQPGQDLWLRLTPEALRCYDGETGLALLDDRTS